MAPSKRYYQVLTVLNALAIPIVIYLLYLHFKPEASDFCTFGEKWNCDIVNKSIYSEILGIPVSAIGLTAYIAFLLFSIRGLFRDQTKLLPYFLLLVTGGTAFTLYLTGIEFFVLRAYCIFCITQQLIILIELATVLKLYLSTKRLRHEKRS